ncbi:MAG: hypothetical protein P4L64_03970 [Caulobacteraceae bacterium]|nr:hypothetical protein [Caulobacteraceae bacterium]
MRHTNHGVTKFGKLQSAERFMDVIMLAVMVCLGGAMVYGLLTATGHVTW